MGGSRVLVVEDDPRLASTLERVLAAEGHDVEVAADGSDALHRARGRPFDLVVLDIMLPGLDGISVCRRLRSTGSVPILLLTALGGAQETVPGLVFRADDFPVKPLVDTEAPRPGPPPPLPSAPPAHPPLRDLRSAA